MPDENPNNGQDEENTAQEQLQTPEQEQYEYEQLPSETTEIDENSEETKWKIRTLLGGLFSRKTKAEKIKKKAEKVEAKVAAQQELSDAKTRLKAAKAAAPEGAITNTTKNFFKGFWEGAWNAKVTAKDLTKSPTEESFSATAGVSSFTGKVLGEVVFFMPRAATGFCRGAFQGITPLEKNTDEQKTDKNPSIGSKSGAGLGIIFSPIGRPMNWMWGKMTGRKTK